MAPLELRLVRSPLGRRLCFAAFVALLALPLLGQALWSAADADIRGTEMRAPNPFPPAPANRDEAATWPRRFEAWLNDRLALRDQLVLADNYVRVKWLGQSTSRAVVLGRQGFLFFTGERSIEQARGLDRFAPEELDGFIDWLEARRAWLAERGIPFLVVTIPNKERVYAEHLPSWAARTGDESRLDQLRRRLRERGSALEVADLEPPLREMKARAQVYYRSDTHWTVAAAYEAGYQPVMEHIRRLCPDLRTPPPADIRLTPWVRPGTSLDLARLLGLAAVTREPDSELSVTGGGPVVDDQGPRGEGMSTWIRPGAAGPRVFWYGDSFSVHMLSLKIATFPELTFVERRNWRFDEALLEERRPDLVVYQFVERFLAYAPTKP